MLSKLQFFKLQNLSPSQFLWSNNLHISLNLKSVFNKNCVFNKNLVGGLKATLVKGTERNILKYCMPHM